MNIQVYNITDDKRTVNKTLSSAITEYINVRLKDDCDLINPIFELSKLQDSNNHVTKINYLYCPYFNRYYFINNVKYIKGGLIELHCHVDVLQSFKSEILSKSAYVTRQEKTNDKKNYFYDSNYPIRSDVTTYPLPLKDNNGNLAVVGSGNRYYLTVNGGVQ